MANGVKIKKKPLHTRVMAFYRAHSRHFALRYLRSFLLAYVVHFVHLLKLLAKIEKRMQNSK